MYMYLLMNTAKKSMPEYLKDFLNATLITPLPRLFTARP